MAPIPPVADSIAIDLDRLLKRLEKSLLSTDGQDELLRTSTYERNRVGANVEYARTLLLRLEHASTNIKVASRKSSTQTDLATKRDLIKRLNQRLLDLNQLDDDDDDDDSSSDSDADESGGYQNTVREYAPAVATTNSIDKGEKEEEEEEEEEKETAPSSTNPASTSPNLRARKPQSSTTGPSDSATTSALFGNRTKTNPSQSSSSSSTTGPSAKSTQAVLDESQRQQDALTTSLVGLAQALKQSSVAFAQSLDSEKTVLGRAEQGLDRNALGMEAAGRRMGALRRMTEGQGWWGRIKLYAIIAALWAAAFLFVFVGPKLRF